MIYSENSEKLSKVCLISLQSLDPGVTTIPIALIGVIEICSATTSFANARWAITKILPKMTVRRVSLN